MFAEVNLKVTDFDPGIGALPKIAKATFSFVMSVCQSDCLSACNNSNPTRGISVKFGI